jgi:hypothetical protein
MHTATAASGLKGNVKGRRSRRPRQPESGRPVVLDFRRAMGAEDRFYRLSGALADLRSAMRSGRTAHIIWPLDNDTGVAGSLLARPLGQCIMELTGSGEVVIHTKGGVCTEFSRLVPNEHVSFVVHLNAEEAAMRWEQHDAAPARRLAMAERLRDAGWNVQVCVGPVRFSSGWANDYVELFRRLAACGFKAPLFRFEADTFDEFISGRPRAFTRARSRFLEIADKVISAGKAGDGFPASPVQWFDRTAA